MTSPATPIKWCKLWAAVRPAAPAASPAPAMKTERSMSADNNFSNMRKWSVHSRPMMKFIIISSRSAFLISSAFATTFSDTSTASTEENERSANGLAMSRRQFQRPDQDLYGQLNSNGAYCHVKLFMRQTELMRCSAAGACRQSTYYLRSIRRVLGQSAWRSKMERTR